MKEAGASVDYAPFPSSSSSTLVSLPTSIDAGNIHDPPSTPASNPAAPAGMSVLAGVTSLFGVGHIPAETWTDIGGVRYDVRAFLESGAHPGGNFLLRMCCGRDATALYLSYHALANTQLVDATLRSLPVVSVSDKSRPALPAISTTERPLSSLSSCDPFYARLIERVAGWERSVPWYVQLAAEWETMLECALSIMMVFVMRYRLLMLPLSVWVALPARVAVRLPLCSARLLSAQWQPLSSRTPEAAEC